MDMLSDFNLSISHDKVLKIETMLSNTVVKEIENNGGVYVPPNISQATRLHFAIDNVVFRNDTSDGKGEFGSTGNAVFKKTACTEVRNLVIEQGKNVHYQYNVLFDQKINK